jgi:hypothetical protein
MPELIPATERRRSTGRSRAGWCSRRPCIWCPPTIASVCGCVPPAASTGGGVAAGGRLCRWIYGT